MVYTNHSGTNNPTKKNDSFSHATRITCMDRHTHYSGNKSKGSIYLAYSSEMDEADDQAYDF